MRHPTEYKGTLKYNSSTATDIQLHHLETLSSSSVDRQNLPLKIKGNYSCNSSAPWLWLHPHLILETLLYRD